MFKYATRACFLLSAAIILPACVQAAGSSRGLTPAGSWCTVNSAVHAQEESQPTGGDQIALVRIGIDQDAVRAYDMGGPTGGTSSFGDFDVRLELSAAQSEPLSGFTHVQNVSQPGSHFANEDRYEEWAAVVPEPPIGWLLAMSVLVVVLRRASLGTASHRFCRTGRGDLIGNRTLEPARAVTVTAPLPAFRSI